MVLRRQVGCPSLRQADRAFLDPYPLTRFDVIETEHDALCETYLQRKLRPKRSPGGDASVAQFVTTRQIELALGHPVAWSAG